MFVVEQRDKVIIKELKRRGKYKLLLSYVKPGLKDQVYALGDFKNRLNGDVFLFHCGFDNPKDNGFGWFHLEDGTPQERTALDRTVIRLIGDNPELLMQIGLS